MSALGHSLRLARVDALRMVRKYTTWSRGASALLSLVVFVLGFVATAVGGGYLAYRAGLAVAAGSLSVDPDAGMAAARGVVAVFGVVVAVVILLRAVGQRGTLTNAEGVLTVVPTGEALVGHLLAEVLYTVLWLAGPALGVGVGLALGTGRPWPALLVPLAAVALAVTAVAAGFPVGLALRHVLTRFPFVVRHKIALLALAFVAYLALVSTGALNAVLVALFEPMQASPTGWLADLAVLGTPLLAPSPVRAAGALAATVALALVAAAVGTRLAERHWFSDPALAGEESDVEPPATQPPTSTSPRSSHPGDTTRSAVARRLARLTGRPMAALTVLAWRRAARAPLKLLYAAYPLLFGVGAFVDIVQTGRVPAYLPVGVLLFVAWAAGVVFTLNPLGDQGAVLGPTLLSRVTGRQFVHAHLLASLAVAVPAGVVLTAVTAALSPLDAATAVGLVATAPPVLVVSSALSVGIGVAFPRFRAVSVTRSMKTVVPSKLAFLLFSLHLLGTVVAGLLVVSETARVVAATLLGFVLPLPLDPDPGTLFVAAAAALAVLVVAPAVSYRYAVRAFDGYTIDS